MKSLEDLGPLGVILGCFPLGELWAGGFPRMEKQHFKHELDLLQGIERSILPQDKQLAEISPGICAEGKGQTRMLKY